MVNPFVYNDIAVGDAFCNREQEMRALFNGCLKTHSVLYAPRGFGKSSLIHELIGKLKKAVPGLSIFYINLYGTIDEADFIKTAVSSFTQVEAKIEGLAKTLRAQFKILSPKLMYDIHTNTINIEIAYHPSNAETVLEETILAIGRYTRGKTKRKIQTLVVWDEFQEIAGYGDPHFFDRLLRVIQQQKTVNHLFSGGNRQILEAIFKKVSGSSPKFVKWHMLSEISAVIYKKWINGIYYKYKIDCIEDIVLDEIISAYGRHPRYIQEMMHSIWGQAGVTIADIRSVEALMLRKRHCEYANIWDNLTHNQKKAAALICHSGGRNVYRTDNLEKVGLKGASQMKKALEILIGKDHIYRDKDIYKFNDILLKMWIKNIVKKG